MAIPPLSLTAQASSGTGSDVYDKDNIFEFGAISVGSGSQNSWVTGLVRDAIVAAIAGLVVKFAWSKIK